MIEINYGYLPDHMRADVRAYVERGTPPGGFLRAVLENRLVGAYGAADDVNAAFMERWARWLYNECPAGAWGSSEAVDEWIDSGGLVGSEVEARR